MTDALFIGEEELQRYHPGKNLAERAHALFLQQKTDWNLAREGYASLGSVEFRRFTFDRFEIDVQFNPGRLTSSSASVDEASVRSRKCFLCSANLPPGQRGVAFGEEYLLLCNPYPIFPEHFTITHRKHTPQRIAGAFPTFLQLSKELGSRYIVFYNGPKCGASAPDHLHFQAGSRGFLPIEREYPLLKGQQSEVMLRQPGLTVLAVEGYLRRCIILESDRTETLVRAFELLMEHLGGSDAPGEEPMVNILSLYEGFWRVILFPRAKHRPSFYYEEGDRRILLSPAAVDLGGVCITPLEEDFRKITRQRIVQMYDEVCLPEEKFARLKEALRNQ
ncbi:MAG: DUF4922 domain-containing protein [Bacteroidota bacterium]